MVVAVIPTGMGASMFPWKLLVKILDLPWSSMAARRVLLSELETAGFRTVHEELLYEGYYGLKGTVKRMLRNTIGKVLGPSDFKPIKPGCAILKCHKISLLSQCYWNNFNWL